MTSIKRGWLRPILILPFLSVALSCDGSLDIREERRIGVIAFQGDPVVVAVPDSVQAGESFAVSVRTYGGGCHREDGTEVEAMGRSADITPYDIYTRARICTSELRMFDHTATVILHEPGIAQITFHGQQMPEDQRISVVRQIKVK